MKLEILSFRGALEYEPKDKSYAIRIEGSFDMRIQFNPLKESDNWVGANHYYFEDLWPIDWKEYSWVKPEDILPGEIWHEGWNKYSGFISKYFGSAARYEHFVSFLEGEGHPQGRHTLFDEENAKKILNEFETIKNSIDTLVIHCNRGKNRSPAVGIAMNEIYGWGIEGLKEKFPEYRKYVYNKMMEVGKNR